MPVELQEEEPEETTQPYTTINKRHTEPYSKESRNKKSTKTEQ
nr:hypothetical protein [Pectobacterium carotovorum]